MIHSLRYTLLLGAAALLVSAPALKAEKAPKATTPPVSISADAPKAKAEGKKIAEAKKAKEKEAVCATDDAKKTAECKADEAQEVAAGGLNDAKNKDEAIRKEAGKGSEQGQAMRKEHSKKWWKLWSKETPAE